MSENIALTTLPAYISFFFLCDMILQPLHLAYCTEFKTALLELEIYWRRLILSDIMKYCKEVLSAMGEYKRGIHSSPRGTFLGGDDR